MKQLFTPNDLLRYIYKEMNAVEEKEIEHQLFIDMQLANEYNNLLEGISILERAEVSPGNHLIDDLKQKLHLNEEEHSL